MLQKQMKIKPIKMLHKLKLCLDDKKHLVIEIFMLRRKGGVKQ